MALNMDKRRLSQTQTLKNMQRDLKWNEMGKINMLSSQTGKQGVSKRDLDCKQLLMR